MQTPDKSLILSAMKAYAIPEGDMGLWYIVKAAVPSPTVAFRHGKFVRLPADTYTMLYRLTASTLRNAQPGEVVMEDTPFELRTHLGFAMQAYGRVLVSGLGLGCVVRGLLANPNVEHVTVLENSEDVLKLVAPHMPTERLTIIEADALEWTKQTTERFDCAWHDVWTNKDAGEPHLDIWHVRLFHNCKNIVAKQGAWHFDRNCKNAMIRQGFPWLG